MSWGGTIVGLLVYTCTKADNSHVCQMFGHYLLKVLSYVLCVRNVSLKKVTFLPIHNSLEDQSHLNCIMFGSTMGTSTMPSIPSWFICWVNYQVALHAATNHGIQPTHSSDRNVVGSETSVATSKCNNLQCIWIPLYTDCSSQPLALSIQLLVLAAIECCSHHYLPHSGWVYGSLAKMCKGIP